MSSVRKNIYLSVFLTSLLFVLPVYAGLGPVTEVTPDPMYEYTVYSVFSSYNSLNNQYLLTWHSTDDLTGDCISAAIYSYNSNGTWSGNELILIPADQNIDTGSEVVSCYNRHSNEYFITWDNSGGSIEFVIVDANAQIVVDITDIDTSVGDLGDVQCCFNSTSNQYFVTWGKTPTGFAAELYFAIVNEDGTIALPATQITGATADSATPFCCYNSRDNQYLVSWVDNDSPHNPYFILYDAFGNIVTSATAIDFSGAYVACSNCYNSRDNQFFLSWYNLQGVDNYSAVLSASGDVVVSPTALGFSSAGGFVIPNYCTYNSVNNTILLTGATESGNAQYALLSNRGVVLSGPSSVASADGYQLINKVYSSFNSLMNQSFISWTEVISDGNIAGIGYFAILTQTAPCNTTPTSCGFSTQQGFKTNKGLFRH